MTAISAEEVARNLGSVLERVDAGEEFLVDGRAKLVASQPSDHPRIWTLSESLARLKAFTDELGYEPRMGEDFANDLEEIVANRKPADRSAWD